MRERPHNEEFHPFYLRYVERVPDGDIRTVLREEGAAIAALLSSDAVRARAEHAYGPGKWTVKEVVGHVADAERVLAYRALRIARGDTTPLPGFDETLYVPAGRFGERTLEDLAAELATVRAATVSLFEGLPTEAWTLSGVANDARISVRALAWIIAGHELHHRAVLRERYLG